MTESDLGTQAAVLAFRDAAERCCGLIPSFREGPRRTYLENMERALVRLYGAALELPDVEPGTQEPLPTGVSTEERMTLFHALNEYLAPYTYYWEVYDPIERSENDVLNGGLGDDLADIYHDLRQGLDGWDAADARRTADVVWNWRFGFESHWGQHLADGLRALHWLLHVHHMDVVEDPESAV